VAQLYPQAPGSLFVASYDSQGYDGSFLTHLQARFRKETGKRTKKDIHSFTLQPAKFWQLLKKV
jgi:hypothetical protein